jgi:hypothetical protein
MRNDRLRHGLLGWATAIACTQVAFAEPVRVRNQEGLMELPGDLANGMTLTLLKNIGADPPPSLSMVVATPKPRLVKLSISRAGSERIAVGGLARQAAHYVVKVEIGGVSGLLAPLLGKQPPDSHVWILQGDAPTFIKSEGPMFAGGPVWRIEVVSPVWPKS